MTTPADKPDQASAVDPGAIDLEKVRGCCSDISKLKAAVEALRSLGAEMAGALAHLIEFADQTGQGNAKQQEDARAVLAATPAEALERARAIKRVLKAVRFFMEDGVAEDSPDLNKVAWQALDKALTNLDALGKEEKENA